jgi:hypothetical protein
MNKDDALLIEKHSGIYLCSLDISPFFSWNLTNLVHYWAGGGIHFIDSQSVQQSSLHSGMQRNLSISYVLLV